MTRFPQNQAVVFYITTDKDFVITSREESSLVIDANNYSVVVHIVRIKRKIVIQFVRRGNNRCGQANEVVAVRPYSERLIIINFVRNHKERLSLLAALLRSFRRCETFRAVLDTNTRPLRYFRYLR